MAAKKRRAGLEFGWKHLACPRVAFFYKAAVAAVASDPATSRVLQ